MQCTAVDGKVWAAAVLNFLVRYYFSVFGRHQEMDFIGLFVCDDSGQLFMVCLSMCIGFRSWRMRDDSGTRMFGFALGWWNLALVETIWH